MAEDELVEIVPNMRMEPLNLLCVCFLHLCHSPSLFLVFYNMFGCHFLLALIAGGLWSILSANGYSGTGLAGDCFEEEREMCNSTSRVDVGW